METRSDFDIVARHVRVLFDDVTVLRDASLTIEPGKLVALKGSSGSGKTTFLHALAGFVSLDGGDITIAGQLLSGMDDADKAALRRDTLGLMTQDFHLLRKLSAERNVALAPLLAGASPQEALSAARRILDRLELQAFYRAAPNRLSRGQRQRVALARALAHPRPILVLDEPTSSLDAASRQLVMDLLREQANLGHAVLFATHDDSLLEHADVIHVMEDGIIQEAS